MADKNINIPKYVAEILKESDNLKPGTLTLVTIYHDNWCNVLQGKSPCNCDPVIGKPKGADRKK